MMKKTKEKKRRYQDVPAYELDTQYFDLDESDDFERWEDLSIEEDLSTLDDLSDVEEEDDDLDLALSHLPYEQDVYEERKSYVPPKGRNPHKNHNNHKHPKRKSLILMLQVVASIAFLVALLILNIFPIGFLFVIVLLMLLLLGGVGRVVTRKRRAAGTKFFSLLISCFLFIGSFYALRGYQVIVEITKDNQASGVNPSKESFGIYISGIDVYGEINQTSRSDVNLLAMMNPKSHEMLLINTPRDYYVTIPGVSGEEMDKLTHAGNYGADVSAATLANLYSTNVPFYMRFNFTSLIDIVDALGGINVYSEIAFTTGVDSGEIVDIKEGKNHLNGIQALAFVRERQNLEDGDNQRGKNQQIAMNGIIKRAISPRILISGNKILKNLPHQVQTNLAKSELQNLIKGYIGGIGRWDNKSLSATGYGDQRYCYSYSGGPLYVTIPDDTSVEEIKGEIELAIGAQN